MSTTFVEHISAAAAGSSLNQGHNLILLKIKKLPNHGSRKIPFIKKIICCFYRRGHGKIQNGRGGGKYPDKIIKLFYFPPRHTKQVPPSPT